ncbi:MAG: polyprenyl synthetase family protein [Anaerolineae bacterium]|jgi:geranylgeranyl diphosphate synthase type I
MGQLETFLERYLPALREEMRAVVRVREPRQAPLFGMLRYHLGWVDALFQPCDARSGKQLRPLLCLLACEGCGGGWEQALPAAAAVELLHNFTLIHDDIEDQDRTRRARPTVWSIWGEPQGINAGDTLFALAQLAMLRLQGRDVPSTTVVEAMRLFNETCVDVTFGQYLDICFESRNDVSVDDYLAMVEGKTGALMAGACQIGALVAGAPNAQRDDVQAFGRHSGLAFQMWDDILGIWGDSDATGKPVGADIARRKKTLPLLHGLERSAELRSLLAREVLSSSDVRRATDLLEEKGSRDFAERLAWGHHEQALAALDRAKLQHPADEVLRELAQRLLRRKR